MDTDHALRKELVDYLKHERAHASLGKAVKDFPEEFINAKSDGVPYSFWGLLEHIRISQRDMIDFVVNESYEEMEWPDDYWPNPEETATKAMWDESIKEYEKDLALLEKIVSDPERDLFVPIPWGDGQTAFREAMQIIDHTAYHVGEFIVMRRIKKSWQ